MMQRMAIPLALFFLGMAALQGSHLPPSFGGIDPRTIVENKTPQEGNENYPLVEDLNPINASSLALFDGERNIPPAFPRYSQVSRHFDAPLSTWPLPINPSPSFTQWEEVRPNEIKWDALSICPEEHFLDTPTCLTHFSREENNNVPAPLPPFPSLNEIVAEHQLTSPLYELPKAMPLSLPPKVKSGESPHGDEFFDILVGPPYSSKEENNNHPAPLPPFPSLNEIVAENRLTPPLYELPKAMPLSLPPKVKSGESPHGDESFTPAKKKDKKPQRVEKKYPCTYCAKLFKDASHRKRHERIHTGEKPYPCAHCRKTFREASHRKKHERIHTGEKPYDCRYCGQAFSQSSNLKTHLKLHTGEKPYQCTTCQKAFAQMGTLRGHMRIHTGEKPYPCPHCTRKFTTSSALAYHIKWHTGEKRHICTHCGKGFIHKSTLKEHERVHTGEKPYQCDYCKKAFIQKQALKKHIRTHTGEKPYPCHYCGQRFSDSSNRKTHLKVHAAKGQALQKQWSPL